ncbi:MAG: gliding motility-associated ABC transporter ATP-binding subunit GldA [Prevotellaceae bacterium]|jgi:ABC-2 type transport system ATP-binding protein|nr:gliding motility-associated ABC transporter ATP-binding subunit GldA [Prevotellaceae bacterium]
MSVEILSISKRYGEQTVLKNLSFKARQGEVLGFLGPNGAGKSTLMKIITGFIPANEGAATVNGLNVATDPIAVKKHIGYLPEHNPLYLDMYVKEYLRFSGASYGIKKGLKKRVDELIELTDILPERHKKLKQLSKGYRQRVGLAQAMLHDPDVLILDEPTTGLDPNQLVGIRKLISEIGKEKTVILSTHIMQEVEAICDRVVIINKGEVVADNPTSEIRTQLLTGGQHVYVEFLEKPGEQDWSSLTFVDGLTKISSTKFLVESNHSEDIRPLIFNFAVSKGFTIVSLRQNEKKLEEVFRQLTASTESITN